MKVVKIKNLKVYLRGKGKLKIAKYVDDA